MGKVVIQPGAHGEPEWEIKMKVCIVHSVYENLQNVSDIPPDFMEAKNPLYVGAREGQVKRVSTLLEKFPNELQGKAVGFWELDKSGYLSESGELNKSAFKEHDVIYFASPSRVEKQARNTYERLMWVVKSL